MSSYGDRLRELMTDRGETQASLARKSGVRQPTVARILSGETPNPKGDTLRRLASALAVDVSALSAQRPGSAAVREPAPEPMRSIGQIMELLAERIDAAPESTRSEALALISAYLERPEARPRIGAAVALLLAPDPQPRR